MTTLEEFADGFLEEPGYLDFARVGPLSAAVVAELNGMTELFSRVRFGTVDTLLAEDERMRVAASDATGFPADQIVFQPNVGTGLMHAMFGITGGGVLMSAAEFPALPFAAVRASEALHVVTPIWLETDHGRVTPGQIREQLDDSIVAVAVSLVDSRTGYLADIDGIRQVIGDRLLIVDAIQGFGVVDAPYEVADVIVTGGEKWLRSGWGGAFMAMSDRAIDGLTPVFSGVAGAERPDPFDEVVAPTHGARAFSVSLPDRVAEARLAAGLEDVADVGVAVIQRAISERVDQVIELADEFGLSVASSRDPGERAGIIVIDPPADRLTTLTASLFNHGITARTRETNVRLSIHVSFGDESLDLLRAAFTSYASAI